MLWRIVVLQRRRVLAAFVAAITVAGLPLSASAQDKSITVFAAASMKNALDEVDTLFTNHSGIKVVASYAASSALMEHIEQGASGARTPVRHCGNDRSFVGEEEWYTFPCSAVPKISRRNKRQCLVII